jgi:aldehyde:ferredoxin oxidoreductase
VKLANPDEVLEVRKAVSQLPAKNPVKMNTRFEFFSHVIENVPYRTFNTSCTHACDRVCFPVFTEVPNASRPGLSSAEMGCIAQLGIGWEVAEASETQKEKLPLSWPLWRKNLERGMEVVELMNEYGLNQYEILGGIVPWLYMATHEGLLTEKELGLTVDPERPEWWVTFLHMLAYREGFGDLLSEGASRAINILGREKYSQTPYSGERGYGSKKMPTPVSLQQAWGYAEHYSGRGINSTEPYPDWLLGALTWMTQTRDAFNDTHRRSRTEWMRKFREDPYRGEMGPWITIWNENRSEFKCSLVLCDYAFPMPYFASAESYLFSAVTGRSITSEEADLTGERLKNMQRAVLIRNHGRSRKSEVDETLPFFKRPDGSTGEVIDEKEFSALVDSYYDQRGWDRINGWPTRVKLEALGLKDVADALEPLTANN